MPTPPDGEPTGFAATTITVRPWVDPVVDDDGHDPRSRYVELFWLGVFGPTATWLLRRFAGGFDDSPDGYDLDLEATARAIGLSYRGGRSAPFRRAIQRCVMFGAAHRIPDGLVVRRRLPNLSVRQVRRLPDELQQLHDEWIHATVTLDELTRAHRLATTLVEVDDDVTSIERHLLALGVRLPVASQVSDNVLRLRAG